MQFLSLSVTKEGRKEENAILKIVGVFSTPCYYSNTIVLYRFKLHLSITLGFVFKMKITLFVYCLVYILKDSPSLLQCFCSLTIIFEILQLKGYASYVFLVSFS